MSLRTVTNGQQRWEQLADMIRPDKEGRLPLWQQPGGLMAMSFAAAAVQMSRRDVPVVKRFHQAVLKQLKKLGNDPFVMHGKADWGCWLWSLGVHVERERYPSMPRAVVRHAVPLVNRLLDEWDKPEQYWGDVVAEDVNAQDAEVARHRGDGVFTPHLAAIYGGIVQFDRWVKVPHIEQFLGQCWEMIQRLLNTEQPSADDLWTAVPFDVLNPAHERLLELAGRIQEQDRSGDLLSYFNLVWYWSKVNALRRAATQLEFAMPELLKASVAPTAYHCLLHAVALLAELEFIQAKKRMGIWQLRPLAAKTTEEERNDSHG